MRIRRIVLPATAIILSLLVYGRTVQIPLFMDDTLLFRWMEPLGLFQIWAGGQMSSFYRPMPMTFFKLIWYLQGHYDPFTLHVFVVLVYIVNVALLGLLVQRIAGRMWAAVVAIALFVAFPFSYQVVPYVTNLFHVAFATGLLAAILLGFKFLDSGSRWALVGAWIAAFLGIFSHENGVLAPLLVGLILGTVSYNEGKLRGNLRRLLWVVVPIGVITLTYIIAWKLVPKYEGLGGIQWGGMAEKIAYSAQGVVYPFSALIRPLVTDNSAVVGIIALLTIVVIATALLLVFLLRRNTKSPHYIYLMAALLWVVLAVTPGMLLLPSAYWLGSSRLLYLSSIGVVLFWTMWLVMMSQHKYLRIVGYGITLLFFAVGIVFTVYGVGLYSRLGDFYHDLIRLVQAQPAVSALSVNNPSYIAPRDNKSTFLIGAEGASYMADYVQLKELLWLNTGSNYSIKGVGFAQTLPSTEREIISPNQPWLDWDKLDADLAKVQTVYTLKVAGNKLYPVKAGESISTTNEQQPLAHFQPVELINAQFDKEYLLLQWKVTGKFNSVPFVHVMCDGKLAGQADGPPLGGLHPFDRWQVGEQWIDYREISSPCTKIDTISVGLYDPVSGERLKATLADGQTVDEIAIDVAQ